LVAYFAAGRCTGGAGGGLCASNWLRPGGARRTCRTSMSAW